MQAENFYQMSSQVAVDIVLVSKKSWLNLSHQYQSFLSWQVFSANVGEVLLVVNAKGDLEKALLGTGEDKYFQAIAAGALKLPPGTYRLEQPMANYDVLAWSLAQYKFIRYKAAVLYPRVLVLDKSQYKAVSAMTSAIFKVRDLINTPAEDMGPLEISDVLKSLAQGFNAEFSSIVGDDLLTQNFPAIYTVGRAAVQAPRLLCLEWGNSKHPLVTLVGKGVSFDSGGLDLKAASQMRLMKKDMGGAAQVIGLAQLIMQMQLPIRLQVLIAAVENTIDAKAYRPGDVIRMRNGLHVEIENTDAEGRLILADALTYAQSFKPKLLMDFATLTGAARGAVGTEISALFTNSNPLAQTLMQDSMVTHDPIWQLPLYEGYYTMLDSTIADMANSTSSSYAGAITAALFLKRFVDAETTWAHFDLMAWNVTSKPGKPEGGEAMAILTVFHYLQEHFI
jgi:leucyl aminopeptidase